MTARAVLVDDHVLFAEAVRSQLQAAGIDVVAVANGGHEALSAVREHRPDLVLVDLRLGQESGLDVGRAILDEAPQTTVLALTALDEAATVREALRAGFGGYLTKDISIRELVAAVRTAVDGQVVVSRRSAPSAVGRQAEDDDRARLLADQLTTREREILTLIAEGATGPQIASRLGIAPNTVRTHVQSVLTKLQVHSRLEAAAFAIRYGLVDVSPTRRYA